jgi:hypothetical protein
MDDPFGKQQPTEPSPEEPEEVEDETELREAQRAILMRAA